MQCRGRLLAGWACVQHEDSGAVSPAREGVRRSPLRSHVLSAWSRNAGEFTGVRSGERPSPGVTALGRQGDCVTGWASGGASPQGAPEAKAEEAPSVLPDTGRSLGPGPSQPCLRHAGRRLQLSEPGLPERSTRIKAHFRVVLRLKRNCLARAGAQDTAGLWSSSASRPSLGEGTAAGCLRCSLLSSRACFVFLNEHRMRTV